MSASNKLGHGIGTERIKQVLNSYPNLLTEYKKWGKREFIDKIIELDGWEEKTASLLVNNFNKFIKLYNEILEYIVRSEIKQKKGKLMNKKIVFSGFRDKNLEKHIENEGGIVSNSVNKNTDYLVIKEMDTTTGKIKKALELNIIIITYDEFMNKFGFH